ncbi:hypothetical protein [Sphingomonas sp. SORGH_AS_0879]|uniref:hypothetical protein n=1 Tax=Sphingomonas sp. SORGH_AS_0879 TaxID=3041790 RepID=UPI00278A5FF6|nr:hypothetical protein [Sphingomonas sp. SORGH_AS_0879]MDQ1231772.1 hypothetical protein [Sphingomonas sp. SORGH_AS_0879]
MQLLLQLYMTGSQPGLIRYIFRIIRVVRSHPTSGSAEGFTTLIRQSINYRLGFVEEEI